MLRGGTAAHRLLQVGVLPCVLEVIDRELAKKGFPRREDGSSPSPGVPIRPPNPPRHDEEEDSYGGFGC